MKSLSAFEKFARSDISSDVLRLKNIFFYIYSASAIHLFLNTTSVKTYRNESKKKGSNEGKKLVSQHWIIYNESKIFSPSYCFGQTEAHLLGLQRHELLARQRIPPHLLLIVARMVLLGQVNCGPVL